MTYAYVAEDSGDVLAFFSVSNDSIKREDLSRSGFRRVMEEVPHPKRYKSMPAAKIGRLGTCVKHQSSGIGTQVLDYLKVWFTVGNKTGCRFLVVDANNNTRALAFYERNGFEFLTPDDVDEGTRIMYFDLIKFRE